MRAGTDLVIDGLVARQPGDVVLSLCDDATGTRGARSNPLRIGPARELQPFWADMHGQSEETIGTTALARTVYLR